MAEIGYSIVGKVLVQLGSRALQEISSAWGVRSDLKKLERTLSAIKAVMKDAEQKQASDERLKIWLGELKDVLIDAENVLDEFQYRVLQKKVMKTYGSTSEKVSHFFSSSNPLAVHFAMAHKIKGIRKSLDDINALKDTFNLAQGLEEDKKISMHEGRETHSNVSPDENIVGRDDDKEKIIHLLMQQNAGRKVGVIPIVGMGGLGKTTLAKLAYNDDRVVSYFQLRMWVCVSENFDLKRLITEILIYEIGTIDESLSLEQLQKKLGEFLEDKRFLLVLDDVWNEDRKTWTKFKALLDGGCSGSKIIVTTRNTSVATIMDTGVIHHLDALSTENCLSLFVELAFKKQEEKKNPMRLKIGEEIVKKCKGVPLAVNTLANMLYSKVDEEEWKQVRDNNIWHLKQGDDDILPILQLSYNQLPFHLKQCFVYCSLFPKDYEFKSVELIQIWMANGILKSPDENQQLEDVGDSYIKELLSRSFFQDAQEEIFCYTFKMHDLYHDLALSIAKGECLVVPKQSTFFAEVSCLSFSNNANSQEVIAQSEKLSKAVQTIIFQTEQPVSLVEACISRFKYLRVLNLKDSSFEVLSSSIGSLKHLRFFDLSGNDIIKQIPNSICKLYNLQTLILDCKNLERLPKGIRNMISLRFLVVTNNQEYFLEKAIGCLNSLRFFFIAQCQNLKCLFDGMDRHLINLQTLVIAGCPSLTSLSLNIKDLTALETLIIVNCEKLNLMEGEGSQNLELSLRKLMIRGLPELKVLPQWLRQSANTLQMLVIGECENFTTLPEWLPCLKSLQQLEIDNCHKLLSLPEGMQGLTTLGLLNITGCPHLSRKYSEDRSKIAHETEVRFGYGRLENQLKKRSSYGWHNKFWRTFWSQYEMRLLVSLAALQFIGYGTS